MITTKKNLGWLGPVLACALVAGIAAISIASAEEESGTLEAVAKPKGYVSRINYPKALGDEENARRSLASNEDPLFRYVTFYGPKPVVENVTVQRWKEKFKPGGRRDYLLKFYYANTREESNRGLRHVACFSGSIDALRTAYFPGDESLPVTGLVGEVTLSPSSDGYMLGLTFDLLKNKYAKEATTLHVRIPACDAPGKMPIVPGLETLSAAQVDEADRKLASVGDGVERMPAGEAEEAGFAIFDKVKGGIPKNLPTFALRGDYPNSKSLSDRPWKGMDITTEEGAEKFAVLMQKYFYEGMATQDVKNADQNFIAQKSEKRYWCHMPWLNVGPSGREAIHGLTMERPLAPSSIYPKPAEGTDWGIGYYNAPGCATIGETFGSEGSAKNEPDWGAVQAGFPDGTVSVKILFTTADFPALKGAYTWKGNTSLVGSTARQLRDVRHVQMDIAVKDSSLKGPKHDGWVMLTYYYDAKYKSPISIPGLPSGLKGMRPMGVQGGFDPPPSKDSIILSGAKTNQNEGRLNGPADNPKSSCLGCHGTAGTRLGMAPGVTSNEQWEGIKDSGTLDFSQQIALAKRNYETRKPASRAKR